MILFECDLCRRLLHSEIQITPLSVDQDRVDLSTYLFNILTPVGWEIKTMNNHTITYCEVCKP